MLELLPEGAGIWIKMIQSPGMLSAGDPGVQGSRIQLG
jgi:hypothetical protein